MILLQGAHRGIGLRRRGPGAAAGRDGLGGRGARHGDRAEPHGRARTRLQVEVLHDRDGAAALHALAALLKQDCPGREFNIEGYPSDDFLALVERAEPEQVTFVPDDPLQATSDHGWDIEANQAARRGRPVRQASSAKRKSR